MRIAYDERSHGLYIRFSPATYVESEEVTPGVVIDFDSAGKPIALEIEDVRGIIDEKALSKLTEPRITAGADLRDFRERLGLTQKLLAKLLGIPKNTIARWERQELAIEKPRLLALALASLTAGSQMGSTRPSRSSSASERPSPHAQKTKMTAERVSAPKSTRAARRRK